jgi:hypothetical protein
MSFSSGDFLQSSLLPSSHIVPSLSRAGYVAIMSIMLASAAGTDMVCFLVVSVARLQLVLEPG